MMLPEDEAEKYDMAELFEKYHQLAALANREISPSGQLLGVYGTVWNN